MLPQPNDGNNGLGSYRRDPFRQACARESFPLGHEKGATIVHP